MSSDQENRNRHTEKPKLERTTYGNRNYRSRRFRTSVRKASVEVRSYLAIAEAPRPCEKLSCDSVPVQRLEQGKRQQLAKWCFLPRPGTTCPGPLEGFPIG